MIGFSNEDINNPLAYIVENDVIMAALKRRLNCAPNKVNVHFNSFPKSFHNIGAETREMPSEHTWLTIGMNSEDKVHTQLLVSHDTSCIFYINCFSVSMNFRFSLCFCSL